MVAFLYSIESILAKRIKIVVPGRRVRLVGRFEFEGNLIVSCSKGLLDEDGEQGKEFDMM